MFEALNLTKLNKLPALILPLSCLMLCSCSASKTEEAPITELKAKNSSISASNRTEDAIFNEALRQYSLGLWGTARDQFDTLLQNYPNGAYQEFAELKLADCDFENSDYASAAVHYEEYSKNHPGSQAYAYALLRAGRSNQLISKGVGRDSSPLEKARGFYSQVLTKFPESIYASSASLWQTQIVEALASYEQMVADFYNKQNLASAEQARQATYSEKWQPLLNQSKLEQEKIRGRQVSTVALARLKDRQTLIDTPQLVSIERVSIGRGNRKNSTLPAAITQVQSIEADNTNSLAVERVECKPDRAILSFQHKVPSTIDGQILKPSAGFVKLSIKGLAKKPRTFDCHGYQDLQLTADERIVLATESPTLVMTLHNPERVVLVSIKPNS